MKLVLRIFNLILIGLSAIAIGFTAFTPLMQVNVDYTVKKEDMNNLFKQAKLTEGDGAITEEELTTIINREVGDEGLKFELALKLDTKGMKEMRDSTNEKRVETLYAVVVKPVIQQVVDNQKIKAVVSGVAEVMATNMASKTLKEQILDNLCGEGDKTQEFLNGAGITDDFIKEETGIIYNALTGKDAEGNPQPATIENVTNAIISVLSSTQEQFNNPELGPEYDEYKPDGDEYKDFSDPALRETIQRSLDQMLKDNNLADKDGNILSVDEALAMIIEKGMGSLTGGSSSESSSVIHARLYADPPKKTLSDVIADTAWSLINQNIGSSSGTIAEIVGYVCTYGVIVQYVFIGMWAVLAIFALIKVFLPKKPYVYMGFGWWIAIVLFGIIELVFGALLFIKPILSVLPITLPEALANLNFSIYSNLSVCWICNTVLFFFSIAYAIIAHKVKQQNKIEKRASKAAANA